ncbi:MAG: UDP-N-acetylglucosamine 2-epimerase (non-hydrolyzing) [Candidatus Odinarchaeota archaeon]|nr:UDP-N-acetylglucosamine 2-epimerase (non-hydrolyzing) [Candidatus Odinarchaeota archaeon]
MPHLLVITGTRPEIIKMAPIIRELNRLGIEYTYIHTGQHYDYELSLKFIEDLNLPMPDIKFKLENREPAAQMGEMMLKLGRALNSERDSTMLAQGDTNSMAAAVLVGIKSKLRVGHVEAGLRSHDWRMPEEHNRILADHLSDILFAPTSKAKENLLKENVHGTIYVTGNTVIDATLQHIGLADKMSNITDELKFDDFILVTAHRAENVDDPRTLKDFVEVFLEAPLPVVYPIHPRTKKNLREFGLWDKLSMSDNVQILPPLGYFDFLKLMKSCRLIVTDSGGIQEEATAPPIRKPVIVMRKSTERPEAVEAGFAKVVGTKKEDILKGIEEFIESPPNLDRPSPFGDGKAGSRIVRILKDSDLL